jgi:sulfatase maturation enzyme AslB (radical SAM superfamily)
VYCYIPKNKSLRNINKQWSERYKDNSFYEIISEKYHPNALEAISLWGGEPSLGFKDLKDVESLVKHFKRLKSISTSSNLTNFSGIKYILEALDKTLESIPERSIDFSLQVSIDGTEEDTDRNRGRGTYKKIIENIDKLIEVGKKLKKVILTIHVKSTNTAEDYKKFTEDPSQIKEYLSSFDEIDEEFQEKIKGLPNVKGGLRALPTLALPGDYTKEDGVNFYKYHVELERLLKDEFSSWPMKRDMYYSRLLLLIQQSVHLNRLGGNRMFCCSAGSTMLGIDPDGSTHGCHGSFWYNYEDYLSSITGQADWCEGERIIDFEKEKFWESTKVVMANYRDKYNTARIKYLTQGFVYHVMNYLNITYGTIKMLAISNQINQIYKDDRWAKLFAYFIALKSSCWFNNYMVTGSMSVTPLSIYRIYGNGMFEYTAKKLAEDKLYVGQ